MSAVIVMTNGAIIRDMLERKIALASQSKAAEIVNKCSLQTMIGAKGVEGAVHLTKKAKPGKIKQALGKQYHSWGFNGKSQRVKLVFLKASKKMVKQGVKFTTLAAWNARVAEESQRILAARNSSCAFIAAGWLSAARAAGGHGGASANRRTPSGIALKPGGRASRGIFRPATPGVLVADAYNVAVEGKHGGNDASAYAVALAGLELAKAANYLDMANYVVRKEIEEVLGKFSDK